MLTSYDLYASGRGTSLAGSGVNQGETRFGYSAQSFTHIELARFLTLDSIKRSAYALRKTGRQGTHVGNWCEWLHKSIQESLNACNVGFRQVHCSES